MRCVDHGSYVTIALAAAVLSLPLALGTSFAAQPIMRSLESRMPTKVTFENKTGKSVRIFWLDYQGKEVLYRELAPGARYVQPTYETHPWRVRDRATGAELKTIVAGSSPQIVVAEAAAVRTPREKEEAASTLEDIRVRTRVDAETGAKFSLSREQVSSPYLIFHPAPKGDPCVWTLPHAVHVLVDVPADVDLADLSEANRLLERGRDYALAECGQPTEGQKAWGATVEVRLFKGRFNAAHWEDGWRVFARFSSFHGFKLRTDSRDFYANRPYAELRRRQEEEKNRTERAEARRMVSSTAPVASPGGSTLGVTGAILVGILVAAVIGTLVLANFGGRSTAKQNSSDGVMKETDAAAGGGDDESGEEADESDAGSSAPSRDGYIERGGKKYDVETDERIIKQDGKTYRWDTFLGWVPDKDWLGDDKVERDFFGDPKVERDFFGDQKIERDWLGDPIIPPEKDKDKRLCLLTTACVRARGLGDDCIELQTLRTFRDEYVKGLPGGQEAIREYYEIAPAIVRAIDPRWTPKTGQSWTPENRPVR